MHHARRAQGVDARGIQPQPSQDGFGIAALGRRIEPLAGLQAIEFDRQRRRRDFAAIGQRGGQQRATGVQVVVVQQVVRLADRTDSF